MKELITIAKDLKNGMTAPLGISPNGNFLFIVKDKQENLNKFIDKINDIDTSSGTVSFNNRETKKSTRTHIVSLKLNTGNFYPLYIIEGVGMLDMYSKTECIEIIFTNGKDILPNSATLDKEEINLEESKTNDIEEFSKVFNHLKQLEAFQLEGILAQVNRGEIKPNIDFN